jgi:ribosomal protein S18 acetylase RimI-like enzyme
MATSSIARDQIPITTVDPADEQRAIDAIVLAFGADPCIRWLYPDPHEYLTYFPGFAGAFGGRAFEHGTVHQVDAFAGVAMWLPPGVGPDEDALGAFLQRSVAPERQETLFAMLEQMGTYHPDEPHWYLPVIGVDPMRQCRGYGSALLSHALARCDRENLPAYLESSNPKNISLYRRHGFEVLATIQFGSAPPVVPMLRKPRPL